MIEINDFYIFKKIENDPILDTLLNDAILNGASTSDEVKLYAKEAFGAIIYTSSIEGWWGVKFTHPRKLTMFLLKVQ